MFATIKKSKGIIDLIEIAFIFALSLLLLHEMDAVHKKEWNMFITLKDMPDERARNIFIVGHLPLYFAVLFLMANGWMIGNYLLYYGVDVFLIVHAILHFYFRKHKRNKFNSVFSKTIIYMPAVFGIIHLCILFGVR